MTSSPRNRRRSTLFASVACTVGTLLAVGLAAPATAAAPRVSVVSHNVANGMPVPFPPDQSLQVVKAQIAANKPSVIALQEACRSDKTELTTLGYTAYFAPMRGGSTCTGGKKGTVIAVKSSFAGKEKFQLDLGTIGSRTFTLNCAKFTMAQQKMLACSVHLPAGKENETQRDDMIKRLAGKVKEWTDNKGPEYHVIFAGDFNTKRNGTGDNSGDMNPLLAVMNEKHVRNTVDHLLASKNASRPASMNTVELGKGASDHHAWRMTFTLM